MEKLQIAITGAVGAGKTSFVKAISEIDVVDTERRATDEIASIKATTTVALDFGKITLNSGQILYLYGTPGQFRFDFMWDIIIRRVDAYILLVDAHSPQYFRHSRRILSFMRQRTQIPMIIGLTHTDYEDAWQANDIALALGMSQVSQRPPIVNVNADRADSVAKCLLVLVERLIQMSIAGSGRG
jgi:hypothetical protein